MHFYWRVVEELKFLGENWIFLDPALSRSYRTWIVKNARAIALNERTGSLSQYPFLSEPLAGFPDLN